MDETQMTTMILSSSGASSTSFCDWHAINWQKVTSHVKRLQMRIAKATAEGRTSKVKALQRLLTTSYHAKLLAIRRVTTSSGSKTPGVDGVTWQIASEKLDAAKQLNKRGYRAQPLRRVNIPKKNGKTRPLGIPTMKDRAMQALYLLALEPISETLADGHSYGFRPKRSAADAIGQCFNILAKRGSAEWILEGDIKACFDQINHQWLLDNIVMNKVILSQWLKAGYVEMTVFHNTEQGTPQGGIISPTLANMALDSMADAISNAVRKIDRCNFVRYADDFIITGTSRQILESKVKPAIEKFLSERGLRLSDEKTLITHIDKGYDFLGFNVRRYKGKLLIKPSKKSVKALMGKIHEVIFSNKATTAGKLIEQLNPIIQGWANYYQHVVSKETFSKIDHNVFQMIRRWCKRQHPNKNAQFWKKKYFRRVKFLDWIFYGGIKKADGSTCIVHLIKAAHTSITRHIKIRSDANPYDPKYKEYFEKRRCKYRAIKKECADSKSKRLLGQELGF